MGQCVTINVGNRGAVIPEGGGSNISVGNTAGEEEEEEEEDCLMSCLGKLGCVLCL